MSGRAPAQVAAPSGPRPFLKWAGGKRQLLGPIRERFPARLRSYFEPFLGGGAVFFSVGPARATLGDVNADLIHAYRTVRDHVAPLVGALRVHERRHSKDHYYAIRAQEPNELSPVERAARLVYLNRTCFNGLYRVNRAGRFNVPIGSYTNPVICDEDNLLQASRALRGVRLENGGFELTCARAGRQDFVYFDPPYVPLSSTASFTSYASGGFGPADQQLLAETFTRLSGRGVRCMLSNSSAPQVLELYRDFNIQFVEAARAVNSNGRKRGKVREVIITNYD